jgi:hypothetical protein
MKDKQLRVLTQISPLIILLLALLVSACTFPRDVTSKATRSMDDDRFPPDIDATGSPGLVGDSNQVPNAKDRELTAYLDLPERILIGEKINLEFTLTNTSNEPLYFLKWYTPLEGIGGEIFQVSRNGQRIPYEGILAYRDFPAPESYVLLKPDESVSADVDLGIAFDFTKVGSYQIEFISPQISHIAHSEDEMAQTYEELGPVYIPSNVLTTKIVDP